MTSVSDKDVKNKESIPDILCDPKTEKQYLRGRFLGKGGFAKCYELSDTGSKEVCAGKIVSKTVLVKQHQKDKMAQEIAVHRSLSHKHIVQFYHFFEDVNNVYVLLELCPRRSLMELHKRRKAVTEPEARYFVKQVAEACQYLHKKCIIHRDLKLGNLFLNDEMEIKVGDFGLATKLDYHGERKKTLCGTPNYIAPEVLAKKGHSYEVDVWSLGCILFTLLVGKPPFEMTCLKDTYEKIRRNEYCIPPGISTPAKTLIKHLLQTIPSERPTMFLISQDPFFSSGYLPLRLPTSCLTMEPRFDTLIKEQAKAEGVAGARMPLMQVNEIQLIPKAVEVGKCDIHAKDDQVMEPQLKAAEAELANKEDPAPKDLLSDLYHQLTAVIASQPSDRPTIQLDECEDPAAVPIYWISKWVDYSDKYGLGYQLCDNSFGVLFNDFSRILLLNNAVNMHYIEKSGKENYHTIRFFPDKIAKKVTLLKYFRNYMDEHLLKAGADMIPRESYELIRLPFLKTWFRTRNAIVLHLSNDTLQINFFEDHTKIILCPLMGAVTYINEVREFRTYRLNLIERYGCSHDLASRLRYACIIAQRLQNNQLAISVQPQPDS